MLRTGYTDVVRPILGRFLAEYPDVRVDISLDETLMNIVTEGFDAGLRLGVVRFLQCARRRAE